MKVLLCSPFETGDCKNKGGIAVWTKNIMDYSYTQADNVEITLLPYNRSIYIHNKLNPIIRIWRGITDYLRLIRITKQKLKSEQFDVLHLSSSALISIIRDYIVMRMAKRFGVKGVIHFHCGRIPGMAAANNWRWKVLKRVVTNASATIVLDNESYKTLHNYGFDNVFQIPNPLSDNISERALKLSKETERISKRLLYVGHVIPTKGVYELVEACAGISNVDLFLVGLVKPEVEAELKEIVRNRAGDWCHLIGEKSHDEVLQEMAKCDVFVFPSYTEGFPNVIIEAMACGCPIIASAVGAIPEMLGVEDTYQSGVVVQPKDVDGLKSEILNLIDNNSAKKELSLRAQKRVKDMYAIDSVWKKIVKVWYVN